MNIKNNINVAKKVLLRRFSGILAVAVLSVISLAGLVSINAWGPADRATFTIAKPASYVTFNSITDNPAYGDERNFFRIKEASANSSTYTDEMKVEPGKTYRGYIYYHNNASKVLNDAAHEYKGVALNTSLRVNLPNSVTPGSKARINAYISADNANPKQVWDEAYMTADSAVAIRYVPGSAKLTNRGGANGSVLADSFLTTGALLGYDKLDGKMPGCNEFSGYVTFDFTVDKPDFTFKKQVSQAGKGQWGDSIKASPGDKVDYLLSYQNTGTTQQNDVVIKDTLPKGMTYVADSTFVTNSVSPKGAKGKEGITTSTGVNYGSYAPKGNLFVQFSATVPKGDQLKCGDNTLKNIATVSTNNGSKNDTADVVVTVDCKPNECKPGIPEGDKRCNPESCTPKDGETVDKDGNCVPVALPTTGPAQIIAGILGVALVSLGVAYWIRSRNEYKKVLAGSTGEAKEGRTEELLVMKSEVSPKPDTHASNFHKK
jgi:uncharacterized repeat protein (TIGR01451 family)